MQNLSLTETEKKLLVENEELRTRLAEAEEVINTIRNGKADAIVVSGADGEKIFSLSSAETPYRIIIEEMNEGAVVLSADGIILYCNRRFAEIVSVPLEQLAGSNFTRFVEERDRPKYDILLQAGLKGKSNGEITCLIRDGNPVHLFLSFSLLPPDQLGDVCIMATDISELKLKEENLRRSHDTLEQKIIERTAELTQTIEELAASRLAAMNMMEDAVEAKKTLEISNKKLFEGIDERKQAEETLKESEEKFRNVFDNSPIGKSITSLDGSMNVNPAFCLMLGYTMEEMTHQKLQNISHPDDYELTQENLEKLQSGDKKSVRFNKRYFKKDGSIIWADVNTVLHKDKEGKPLYYISAVIDITERKRAEEEIQALYTGLEKRVEERTVQLESSNKELEAFAYSVSHDLRAPLRAIDGFSRFLLDDYKDKLDSEGQRLLNVIRTNTQTMDHLITDLLGLSRVNRTELNYSKIDMKTLANSIYHEVTSPETRNKFILKIGPLPDTYGDTILMRQVWNNLLSNAIKYTLPKENCQIEIGGYEENNSNVYYIKDNGVGFNPAYAHKLFGVFQRLHKAEEFEGTGVGLAIVQRIILRHGGKVWAEGELNEGAVFYFSIPVKEADND